LKFIIQKNYLVRGAELMVRNRNSDARCCEKARCGTGLQMVRRYAVRNRQAGAGAYHCSLYVTIYSGLRLIRTPDCPDNRLIWTKMLRTKQIQPANYLRIIQT